MNRVIQKLASVPRRNNIRFFGIRIDRLDQLPPQRLKEVEQLEYENLKKDNNIHLARAIVNEQEIYHKKLTKQWMPIVASLVVIQVVLKIYIHKTSI